MRRLFDSNDDFEVLEMVREAVIVPPSRYNPEVPGELDAIVLTALERDPRRRWQSAAAMRVALRNEIRELGIEITDRRVLQWVEWAFSQDPRRAETSGMNELIESLDDSRETLRDKPSDKQSVNTTVPTVKSSKRRRASAPRPAPSARSCRRRSWARRW